MKRKTGLSVLIGLSLLRLAAVGHAHLYEISWFTIDGGGGSSRGGNFTISGTVGQHDAGQLAGGNYTLNGGFWGLVAAIQNEGAPWLTVSRSGSSVVVKWPFPSTGFVLEQTAAIASPTSAILWTDATAPAAVHAGSEWTVTIPSPAGNRFFRLRKP